MLEALYIILSLTLLYISYSDIKEAQYNNYFFYIILICVSAISLMSEVSLIKILATYLILILSFFLKNKYVDYIGDGDLDLYIVFFMLFSFEKFLYLIIISTLSAIVMDLLKNNFKFNKRNTVRLVPYLSFAFFIIKAFDLFMGKVL